jgi:hypothetical protein
MGFREQKLAARQVVHDTMAQPAVFYPSISGDPTSITARPHSRRGQIGDLAGTNLNYAEDFDRQERVIFWRAQFIGVAGVPDQVPPRGALVIFSSDEGYLVETTEPSDGPTITALVTRLPLARMVGLQDPDGNVIV